MILSLGVSTVLASSFTISLVFDSKIYDSDYSSPLQSLLQAAADVFEEAADFWSDNLDYQGDVDLDGLEIEVGFYYIDGENSILAGSAVTLDTTDSEGTYDYVYATEGLMIYDVADLWFLVDSETLFEVALHEIAHVIGFGTLWEANGLYTEDSYEYTGANALEVYQATIDPDATYVPVEDDGGDGTANAHWEYDSYNNYDTLMLGWTDLDSYYTISDVTWASFVDLGYEIVSTTPVPEPASCTVFGIALVILCSLQRKRKCG